MKILLIEDDTDLAETVRDQLSRTHAVHIARTAQEGLRQALSRRYDAVLLDIILPDGDGVSVCREIRARQITTPILMLTGQQGVDQKVTALNDGADDYLTKPFNFAELTARINALLRRGTGPLLPSVVTVGNLTIDPRRFKVEWDGQEIKLRRKEFLLLEYLARNAGQVVTRQMILDHVWDTSPNLFSNTVDVHVNSLRQKIDRTFNVHLIQTVPGIGYKLEA